MPDLKTKKITATWNISRKIWVTVAKLDVLMDIYGFVIVLYQQNYLIIYTKTLKKILFYSCRQFQIPFEFYFSQVGVNIFYN